MSAEPHPTLDAALEAIRRSLEHLPRDPAASEQTIPVELLMERLADLGDPDGSIPLADGSRLYIVPEQGDRRGDTGRLGAIQRFPDDRPDRTHLVSATRSDP